MHRYDRYRGVISLINVKSGELRKGWRFSLGFVRLLTQVRCRMNCLGDKVMSCHTRRKYDVTDVGILHPEQTPTGILKTGQVGYIACNMKESSEGTAKIIS